jgi:membrane protein implicated in regulation of membrane protease activity
MVLLGVVLVLLAVLAGVLLVTGTASIDAPVAVDLPFGTLSLPPLAFLITGMVVISTFWLGWAVLRAGLRRQKRLRAQATEDAKAAQAAREVDAERMKAEVEARDKQLAEERRQHEAETAALRQQAVAPRDQSSPPTPGA